MRVFVICAIGVLLGACVPNMDIRYGWSQLTPVSYQPSGQVQSAQEGELVLQQEATAANFAVLQQPFSHVQVLEVSTATIAVGADSPLYELTSPAIAGRLFCSLDSTSSFVRTRPARSNILVTVDPATSWSAQTCFVDDDSDGRFEEFTWVNGYANGGPGFGGMMVLKFEIDPIAYGPSSVRDQRTSTLGVQFQNGALRIVGILPPGRVNNGPNGPYLPTTAQARIPRALPATIELQGAQIEVLSRTGDAISYRVVSGFPADPPIATMLMQQ